MWELEGVRQGGDGRKRQRQGFSDHQEVLWLRHHLRHMSKLSKMCRERERG